MSENTVQKLLADFFFKSSQTDWKQIAMQETQGKDPIEHLSWRGKDDILFLPYYDVNDVTHADCADRFQIPVAGDIVSSPRKWINLPAVSADDDKQANALAITHLSSGADGILFDILKSHNADPSVLLENLESFNAFLAFDVVDCNWVDNALYNALRNHANPISIAGALFWESIPQKNLSTFYLNHCKSFKPFGVIVPSGTPAGEISDALIAGVSALEQFGPGDKRVMEAICFSLATDASFPETAAKFKALRMLWYQVAHAYGHIDYKMGDLHIHARSAATAGSVYNPHENMLKGTFAAMAAVLGGCDALTIMTPEQTPMLSRWAKNVSVILRAEGGLHRVADVLAGSYAFDTLVDEIAKKAWATFQQKLHTL